MVCTIAIPKFKKDLFRMYMQSKYTLSLIRAGAMPIWIEPDDWEHAISQILQCDGLLLPGGEDVNPKYYGQTVSEKCGEIADDRDSAEMKILEAFLATGKPILGICRGAQVLNVYFGGTLHQDIADIATCNHDDYPRRKQGNHMVTITAGTKLAGIMGQETFIANSMHHQAADRVCGDLIAAAVSEDGIIEAVEHKNHPFCIGVQWHPEHMSGLSELQCRLFAAFVKACNA